MQTKTKQRKYNENKNRVKIYYLGDAKHTNKKNCTDKNMKVKTSAIILKKTSKFKIGVDITLW